MARHSRAKSVRQLKAALRRDLEWLLNTRRNPRPAGSEFAETSISLYNYGLPDVTGMGWDLAARPDRTHAHDRRGRGQCSSRASRGIKVTSLEAQSSAKHVLRFQIEGLLDMDPAPELITFDTVLQLSSGEYQVKGEPECVTTCCSTTSAS